MNHEELTDVVATEGRICAVRYVSDLPDKVSAIPPEYADYADVFSEDAANTLLERGSLKHAIELEDGTTPPFGLIYSLSEKELKVLREYLQDSLDKGWIRESKSPAGAFILFVPKKKREDLRLCVDYRGLNRITVKNQYPLPLIGEIMDCLVGAKVYTKLDLRNAYHRVRIRSGNKWKTVF
jgi:hypothetical protein